MNNLNKKLTIFMVAYYSNYNIEEVIKKIDKNIKIIIIENSNLSETKKYFESRYNNINVILCKKNHGVTVAFNIALRMISTPYALYLDMDVDFDVNIISKFVNYAENLKNLAILVPQHHKSKYPKSWEYTPTENNPDLTRMNKVHTHFALYNMIAVRDIGYFDEKIFFYFDETDFCMRALKKNYKIYLTKNINVNHIGGASYTDAFKPKVDGLRQWHFMWGKFYYYKKHFSLLNAYLMTLPDFFKSIIKMSCFYFINKNKFNIHRNRFSGLLNAFLGKTSWKRP
jgi:N-acetylglucosaminyl-diphospho-decaprenol L-rhamnosyltransferase